MNDTRQPFAGLKEIARKFKQRADLLVTSRYIPLLLMMLAATRALLILSAYAPAHGPDSEVYWISGERINGFYAPLMHELTPPLYPLLMMLSHYVFGSLYVLLGAQIVLGILLPIIYYFAVRPYSAYVSLASAVIIAVDFQFGILFNFTSTEPIFVGVMGLGIALFLRTCDGNMANAVPNLRSQLILSLLCGLTWAVLMHIRAVTLYLIVPLALLMLLRTKRWQPPLLLLVAFMISSGFISYTTGLLLGQNETPASSNIMMLRIAENHGDWFEPGNGENTRVFLATQATCPGHPFFIYWCLTQEYGSFQEAANVVRGATFETLSLHPEAYLREVIRLFGDYLSLAVPQYGIDPSTPNAAQCQQRNSQPEHPYDLPSMHWTWALPDITDDTNARVRAMTLDAAASFCPPPYAESPQAKALVDSWASRYRSLGRPNAVVWYAALLLTTLAVPWARRCLTPILLLTGVLAYFALIHAILVSVEPRYVVVTNPIRAILLTFLAYFGAKLLAKGAAAVWQRSR